MKAQTISGVFVGDDVVLIYDFTQNGDISSDTFEFICEKKNGSLVFRKTSGTGAILIIVGGSTITKGQIQVSLVDALDISVGDYDWRLRRTNTGREKVIAFGDLPLPASFKGAT